MKGGFGRGTSILMASGEMKSVEDLKEGDIVMGADSSPKTVVHCFREHSELFRMTPKVGCTGKYSMEPYVINENHTLWLMLSTTFKVIVRHHKNRSWAISYLRGHKFVRKSFAWKRYLSPYDAKEKAKGSIEMDCFNQKGDTVNIVVKDYIKQPKCWRALYKGYQVGVEFEKQAVTLDPYFLGLWLGDGSSKKPVVTNIDKEIIDFMKEFAESHKMVLKKDSNISYYFSQGRRTNTPNPITAQLRKYSVFGNKHIPRSYLLNSRDVRLELLAGLLDTDGCFRRNSFEILQVRKMLSFQILFLARSLGFRASIRHTHAKSKKIYYMVYIGGPNLYTIPTKVSRKQATKRTNEKPTVLTVLEITSLGIGESFGFEIEGNDQRIVLGDFSVVNAN